MDAAAAGGAAAGTGQERSGRREGKGGSGRRGAGFWLPGHLMILLLDEDQGSSGMGRHMHCGFWVVLGGVE